MKGMRALFRYGILLPIVLGLADGILTALTLAAGRLVHTGQGISVGFALRIAAGALAAGAFVFYVGSYSRLRGELIRAERELSLTSHGRLAATRLGWAVFIEALSTTILSSLADFVGALVPMLTAVLLPDFRGGAVLASLGSLGILGLVLARAVHGSYWLWSVALVAGGVVLSILGIRLHIV